MKFLNLILLAVIFSCSSNSKKDNIDKKADIYFNQGTTFLINQKYADALANLQKAFELRPKRSDINNNLGMAYYFKKEKAMAIHFIKEAIQFDPANTDAKSNLASIYFEDNKIEQAKELYLAILKDLTYKKHYRTYYNLGLVELKLGSEEKAYQYFTKAVEEEDLYCPAHFQIGLKQYNSGNYQRATDSFKKASVGNCYQNPAPHYYLGLSLLKMQKFTSARIKFVEVFEKFPTTRFGSLAKIKANEAKKDFENYMIKKASGLDQDGQNIPETNSF